MSPPREHKMLQTRALELSSSLWQHEFRDRPALRPFGVEPPPSPQQTSSSSAQGLHCSSSATASPDSTAE